MFSDGKSLPQQLARGCFLILVSAICLYLAAQLLCAVWQVLAIVGGLVALVVVGVSVRRWRQERW